MGYLSTFDIRAKMKTKDTHLPILTELFKMKDVQTVLEYGMGYGSTPFFFDKCKTVVSVEMQNEEWFHKISSSFIKKGFTPLLSIGPFSYRDLPVDALEERYDLIFVDGHGSSRWDVINDSFGKTDIIVAHDTQEKGYSWDRVLLPEGWEWIDIRDYSVWTSVITRDEKVICNFGNKQGSHYRNVSPILSTEEARKFIQNMYEKECNRKSDINEHLPFFKECSSRYRTIVELGVREGTSTWSFLAGHPTKMTSYDITRHPNVDVIEKAAKEASIDFTFKKESSLECDIPETSVLFIDTWHVYDQLIAELKRHEDKVCELIVMHDTVAFGEVGMGYTYGQEKKKRSGLRKAINEFVASYNWEIHREFPFNNGVTVLKRKESPSA